MREVAKTRLRVSQTIRANPERIFRAWTDPQQLKGWWRMEADGWTFAGASVDLKVGGRYRLAMTSPQGKTHVAVGEYREVKPPSRLVFTWDWEDPAERVGDTLVTVQFKNAGPGRTDVVLTHERFTEATRVAGHESGWAQLLRLLDHLMTENSE